MKSRLIALRSREERLSNEASYLRELGTKLELVSEQQKSELFRQVIDEIIVYPDRRIEVVFNFGPIDTANYPTAGGEGRSYKEVSDRRNDASEPNSYLTSVRRAWQYRANVKLALVPLRP